MWLFYIDESGTGLNQKQTPFFSLTTVAVSAVHWNDLDAQLSALKRTLISWAKPEDVEIKGRDIRRGEKFFKPFDWNQRAQLFNDLAQLIADNPCQILSVRWISAICQRTLARNRIYIGWHSGAWLLVDA